MSATVLSDVLRPNLRIVFCGTAAGDRSAQVQRYYADFRNRFWKTLYKVGLTPRQLLPKDFLSMFEFGLGLTDLAKCSVGRDHVLTEGDFDVPNCRRKIELFEPDTLAFNGKEAARVFFSLRSTKNIEYGLHASQIGRTKVWVLPSTSGGNGHWDLRPWEELAASAQ